MDWDQKKSVQLLDEYEKARVLWDPKHPQYYTKSKKLETWERIARKLRIEIPVLKKKMNCLLGSFRRERSKTRRCLLQGKEYNSKWFAYERLKFLSLEKGDQEDIEVEDALNIELNEEDEIYELTLDDTGIVNNNADIGPDDSPCGKRIKLESPSSPPPLRFYDNITCTQTTIIDEFDAIGKNVAAKLRSMEPTQRIVAEKLIHDALFYGQLDKLGDTSCIQLIQTPAQNSFAFSSEEVAEAESKTKVYTVQCALP